ncbi:MAG: AI-2E family transporter [Acidobacteriales bacterium]|nr:AI-2E family transporter [Terriglobales bacterium]
MEVHPHVRTTASALKSWFIATLYDAAAVGSIWYVGLSIIGVPWAPLWALLGAAFQFIPGVGAAFALVGPALTVLIADQFDRFDRFLYVLMLYAVIALVDGLVLQPYLMKRSAKVPIWASILTPIVLGILIPFWGILLSPPLLAVIYTFRAQHKLRASKPAS